MAVRPERVPAEEVRQRMLDAGRELTAEAGLAVTIERLRFEEVIQRARVPRSSVYRLWPYKEQYIDDLLCYLASPDGWFSGHRQVFDPETFAVIEKTIAENRRLLGTVEGRRAVLCEAMRLGVARNYQALSDSLAWRLHLALLATLGSTRTGEARRKIAAVFEEGQAKSRRSLVALFEYLKTTLGLRERDPARTVEHAVLVGGLMLQSMAMRNIQVQASAGVPDADTVSELLNTPIPGPGLDGKPAPWTLAAYSYLALLDAFLEPDPDWTPPGSS
jgi:AcrR family transcriptional regulator